MVNTNDLAQVKAYLQAHKTELMQTYQANGVAIGKMNPTDSHYVIVIYLNDKSQQPSDPVILDGIPVKFEVTGPFTIQY